MSKKLQNNKQTKAEELLESLVNHEISLNSISRDKIDSVFNSDRFAALLLSIQNPQKNFYSIQVAGTNGKGSVVNFLEKIFICLGYQVGTFLSPHLVMVNERIKINGHPIEDNELCEMLRQLQGKGRFTYFEALTAAAFLAFSRNKCTIAVLETGLGGRLDSVTQARASIGIITNISLDHQHILGPGKLDILREKISIVHPEMDLIIGDLPKPLKLFANDFARTKARKFFSFGDDFYIEPFSEKVGIKKKALFQFPSIMPHPVELETLPEPFLMLKNFQLALAATSIFLFRNGEKRIAEVVKKCADNSALSRLHGRLSVLKRAEFTNEQGTFCLEVMFDGGHNPQGASFLATFLNGKNNSQKILFFTAFKDKKILPMLLTLQRNVQKIYLWNPILDSICEDKYLQRWMTPPEILESLKQKAASNVRYNFIDKVYLISETKELLKIIEHLCKFAGGPLLFIFAGSLASYPIVKKMVDNWQIK